MPKELKVGEIRPIWITGTIGEFEAQVISVNPPRLKVVGDVKWPVLKSGDFILRD